ncbi:SulP family inorganic anion transporter [Actinobacillus indolicus]|uniref:SulP family inorganic anion transporter n=1 Tax=Actinobacillus indolicus TaxID=51049 RepID=A0A4P7CHI8_9PAST|nr:SulP family inorganic anion transporter [Actinobacillus indolicus]QBQ63052.1 SulP family inorganic anion transporter [Actinobacillus indolicus]
MIINQSIGKLLKQNFSSGLVVFLVALPLCLGIALASGAPPLAGILSGIVGGIVIGAFSTSHISVSGPAAGLAAIVLAAITELGSFELFLCAGLIAGVVQFILGFVRAGSITNYIPVAVIEGMLAGIGVLIILKQLPYALGSNETLLALIESSQVHLGSLLIALISLAIMIGWDHHPKLKKIKLLPSALVAVIVGILLNDLFVYFNLPLAIPNSQLVQLPIPHSLEEAESLIRCPNFSGFTNSVVWVTGITIAVVASVETLLSIEAADRLDVHRRITDNNHELRVQGFANILASCIGALPMTSVIVRSSANASAGATHKISAVIHGILLLICVISIPTLLNQIPLATLAAVLILIGFKLTHPKHYKHFWHKGIYQFIPFVATMVAVVFLDLLKGVGIGLVISILFILHGNMKRAYYLSREELSEADEIVLELGEEVSFLNKAAIKKTLKNIQPNSKVTINAEKALYIASDVLELLEDFTNVYAQENNIQVKLRGFKYDYEHQEGVEHTHIRVEHRSRI